MSVRRLLFAVIGLAVAGASTSGAQSPSASTGGALLYETYCIACHTKQVHWRDRRLAVDWASLRHQVGRWQANGALQWSDDEIDEVARYLNVTIYHFPQPPSKPIG